MKEILNSNAIGGRDKRCTCPKIDSSRETMLSVIDIRYQRGQGDQSITWWKDMKTTASGLSRDMLSRWGVLTPPTRYSEMLSKMAKCCGQ